MDRFEWCNTQLEAGESILQRGNLIRLYDGDDKTSFDDGQLILTDYRLIWKKLEDSKGLGLSLKYIVLAEAEEKGFRGTPKIRLYVSQPNAEKLPGPVAHSPSSHLKLGFKDGGLKQMLTAIEQAVRVRKWESRCLPVRGVDNKGRSFRSGIVGIERSLEQKHRDADDSISRAFQGLSQLIDMARDMVALSRNISIKIKERQGAISDDETIEFKAYLLSLGIDDPVTRDSVSSSYSFHVKLAAEVASVMEKPIKEAGGMMSLTDVYCRMNRARGLELLSPEDLLNACHQLNSLNLPVRFRQYESGLCVLQLADQDDDFIIAATAPELEQCGSLSAEELAKSAGITVVLAKERLLVTERAGFACQDDSVEGLRFFPNWGKYIEPGQWFVMAWRFQASKFKNAVGSVAKKEEWIHGINVGDVRTGIHPSIAASAVYIAFTEEGKGSGGVGVCRLEHEKVAKEIAIFEVFHPHNQTVTNLEFSPFDDGLLATAATDGLVKLWHVGEGYNSPSWTLSPAFENGIDILRFHPTSDFLLSFTSEGELLLYDFLEQKQLIRLDSFDTGIQSLSWKKDGSQLAVLDNQPMLTALDPRNSVTGAMKANVPSIIPRDAHVLWLSSSHYILVSGLSKTRQREAMLWDTRNFANPVFSLDFGSAISSFLPLQDPESGMTFFLGRGERTISFLECIEKGPTLVEQSRITSDQQTKAACLVPKRALNLMQAEVNRILQLTQTEIIPISYQVPRKSYRDFHADLYPEIKGMHSALSPSMWMENLNLHVPAMELDPSKIASMDTKVVKGNLSFRYSEPGEKRKDYEKKKQIFQPNTDNHKDMSHMELNGTKPAVPLKPTIMRQSSSETQESECLSPKGSLISRDVPERKSMKDLRNQFENITSSNAVSDARVSRTNEKAMSFTVQGTGDSESTVSATVQKLTAWSDTGNDQFVSRSSSFQRQSSQRKSKTFGRVAKYRHLEGTVPPKKEVFENLKGVNSSLPTECDGLAGNRKRFALSLAGPGGKLAILELSSVGRIPDGVLPSVINGASVTDFQWDPFDDGRLAASCDEGTINLWCIPDDGLKECINEPQMTLKESTEKISLIRFHPQAKDVLLAASNEGDLKIWDLTAANVAICILDHSKQVWSAAWSPDGQWLATSCKDGYIRIFDPRKSPEEPARKGPCSDKGRGARVLWALQGKLLITSGFERASERVIKVYDSKDLSNPIHTQSMDVSPSLIMPLYDEDSATLFLYAKGDTTIHTFEVIEDSPYLYPLTPHRSTSPHQALTLLPKIMCDVRKVEFARALRLIDGMIEPIFFTVPRVKNEFFQDDLFPPTRVTWEPSLTAIEWLSGETCIPKFISLQPDDMMSLSRAESIPQMPKQGTMESPKVNANNFMGPETIPAVMLKPGARDPDQKKKQEEVEASLSKMMRMDMRLEQDGMEGVAPHEWDD